MPEPLPVVIEIDDTVDVVLVPADLAARARAVAPHEEARLLQLLALLLARLGAETAIPAVTGWLDHSPEALLAFPEPVRAALVSGTIG